MPKNNGYFAGSASMPPVGVNIALTGGNHGVSCGACLSGVIIVSDKLVIMLLTISPDQPHLCGTPFFQAAAAAAMDVEVEIYFASSATRLLVRGIAEGIHPSENKAKSVYGFMQDASQLGVRFFACGGALAAYAITPELLIPECTGIAGGTAYICRVMDDEWKSITY